MARPSKWNSPTTSIRVPEHCAHMCLALARQMDGLEKGNFVQNHLKEDLVALVRRHEKSLGGLDEWIDVITSPRYQKRTLKEDVLNQMYRDIAFALAGHPTSDGCKGIFAYIEGAEVEQMLLLLLIELLASVDRPTGGSIHQAFKSDVA
jgi:hypothetical protein